MSGSDWNSYSEAPLKRGVPIWGKILMGCGVVALLAIGSCVAFIHWASNSGSGTVKGFIDKKVSQVMEKPWDRMIAVTDAIQTDEGASLLYRDNPMLKGDFPTEADFLKSIAVWRASVTDIPRRPPSYTELDENDFTMSVNNIGNGVKLFEMSYRMPDKTRLRLRWEDEKLVEIELR